MPADGGANRTVPLLRVLARLWRQRDGRRWIVHGHDEHGASASIRVSFDEHGVALIPSCHGAVVLAPLQAGRLRAAIRDAIESIDQPTAAVHRIADAPDPRRTATRWPPSPRPRARVVLGKPETPTRPKLRPLDRSAALRNRLADDRADATCPIWPKHDQDGDMLPGGQGDAGIEQMLALPAGCPLEMCAAVPTPRDPHARVPHSQGSAA